MENLDAEQIANTAVRFGLLEPHHVQEAWDEIGARGGAR
jgi:hypothetical protein